MGRHVIPIDRKKVTGTFRKHREKKIELPERGVPRMPPLPEEVKSYWDLLVARLKKVGTLTKVDDLSLAAAARDYALYIKMSDFISENGETYEFVNAKGETVVRPRPELRVMHDAYNRFYPIFKRYGLDHASRKDLRALPEKPKRNKWDEYKDF
jgi:P27 family predicted phage terminase small subunit